MKITQKDLVNRIYANQKTEWSRNNIEDKVVGSKIVDGMRYEQVEGGEFKPFWQIKRFDALVSIRSRISYDVKNDVDYVIKHLNKGESVVVNNILIKK